MTATTVGGPLLVPEFEAILLTPISPHTLTQRPLVLPETSDLEIRVQDTRGGEVRLTVDGQVGCALKQGDRVRVRRSPHPVRMLVPPGRNRFEGMRAKLGLDERSQGDPPGGRAGGRLQRQHGLLVGAGLHGEEALADAYPWEPQPWGAWLPYALQELGRALRAVDHAGFMLTGTDVKVAVFHSKRDLKRFLPKEVADEFPELQKFWQRKAGKVILPFIQKAKDMLLESGLREDQITTKLVDGSRSAAADILEEIKTSKAGSLFMGLRGYSNVGDFAMGSVTRKVLNHAENMAVCVVP